MGSDRMNGPPASRGHLAIGRRDDQLALVEADVVTIEKCNSANHASKRERGRRDDSAPGNAAAEGTCALGESKRCVSQYSETCE
jgi:hypothetical protein